MKPYVLSVEEYVVERDDLEDPDVDGSIVLWLIFRKWDGGGMDWI